MSDTAAVPKIITVINDFVDEIVAVNSPIPATRRNDPVSSMEAEEYMQNTETIAKQRTIAILAVRDTPGLTALELSRRHHLDRYMLNRRLPEAEKLGHVRRDWTAGGKPVCRQDRVGNRMGAPWWPA